MMREWVKYERRGIIRFRRMGRDVKNGFTAEQMAKWPSPMEQIMVKSIRRYTGYASLNNPLLEAICRGSSV